MTIPGDFFRWKEVNTRIGINDAESLWAWLATQGFVALAPADWSLRPGETLFFRGQSNADYGLSSKLYRDVRQQLVGRREVLEADLETVEARLLEVARDEGLGRRMSDGELLMVMQHHGIATRLLDVSKGPLEALFFAVDQHADLDGRLFLIHPHPASTDERDEIALSASPRLPWTGMARGRYAKGSWTQRVAVVTDPPLDPRMRAQDGTFLAGGLIKRYRGQRMVYRLPGRSVDLDLDASQFSDVSTLNINFIKSKTSARNPGWGATGWVVRVPAEWKRDLLRRLRQLPESITSDTMYPPVDELVRLSSRELRLALA